MEKFNPSHLDNIQSIVERETGTNLHACRRAPALSLRKAIIIAACLICLLMLSAFAYARLSIQEDRVGFSSAYQGAGRFEIAVINDSDQALNLQRTVKVMQWSTAAPAEGNSKKIRVETEAIPPHSRGVVSIDLSEGYDLAAMEENLTDGDGYYFILTNNCFVFGYDWMCSFNFEPESTAAAEAKLAESMRQAASHGEQARPLPEAEGLWSPDWHWPTGSRVVSAEFGLQENGAVSDHVNFAGTLGEEVYAVDGGTVVSAGFESDLGNVIMLELDGGVQVSYGYLESILVSPGDTVSRGQVIGTLGQTGTATGPNLRFGVTADGTAVNPLSK